ncbi:MAG: zf-HC2 domain-containing protein [Planctomycetaceae bacterium]
MTPPFDSNDQWSQCPIGYLQRYALVEKRQLWLRLAGRAAVVIALLAVTASSAVYSYRSISPPSSSSLTAPGCHEIVPLLEDFKAGKLSPEDASKARRHLDECYHCRRMVSPDAMSAGTPLSPHACPMHAMPPGAPVTAH